jgi:superfamily II DNA or RNA helicase
VKKIKFSTSVLKKMSSKLRKSELVEMAVKAKLVKNPTEATKKTVPELMNLLNLNPAEEVCPGTKAEVVQKYANRISLLNLSSADVDAMTRDALCGLLFPKNLAPFDKSNCATYTQSQIQEYSAALAVPLGQDPDSGVFDKTRACDLLSRTYNTVQDPNWMASDIDTCMVPKDESIVLQPHQKKVAAHILAHRGLLAVHDVGTGKTFAALASVQCMIRRFPNIRVVVLTPRSLIDNFRENAKKFFIPENRYEIYSYDTYVSFYKRTITAGGSPDFSDTFLIVDEAHNLRNKPVLHRSQENEDDEEIQAGIRAAVIMKAASQAFRVLLLTATPFVNKYDDVNNLLMMVKGDAPEGPRLAESKLKEMIEKSSDFGFNDLWSCRVSYHMPPRDAHYPELLPEHIVSFIMSDPYYNAYRSVETKTFNDHLASKIGSSGTGTAFFNKLRRAVNLNLDDSERNPKIDWVLDFIKKQLAGGRKSVVYSNWKHAGINQVRESLDKAGIKYVYITGDVDGDTRTKFVEQYNNPDSGVKVILISRAGAEGLNLMETRNVIILESNWNPAIEKQIVGRAVRYNSHAALPPSERTVEVWRLIVDKPTDHKDNRNSIDRELFNMSYRDKKSQEEITMRKLSQSSIELNTCKCKRGAATGFCAPPSRTVLVPLKPSEKEEKPKTKALKTTYVAPPVQVAPPAKPSVFASLPADFLDDLF